MPKLVIRDLDEKTLAELRLRAARHGRSVEAEAQEILRSALMISPTPPKGSLSKRIHRRFAELGGVDLELPPRDPIRGLAKP